MILGLTLLVSIMGVVSAEEYVDPLTGNNVIEHGGGKAETDGFMVISYEVGSNTYLVYIPPSFAFTATKTTVVSKVNATDVVITPGSELVVNIESKHGWTLKPHNAAGQEIDSESEMPYSVSTSPTRDGGDWDVISVPGSLYPKRILTVPASTGTEPATDETYLKFELSSTEATVNAVYKDTVTFSVGVITSP